MSEKRDPNMRWSGSGQKWVDIRQLHDRHLIAALRTLERGEYRGQEGEVPSVEEDFALRGAFAAEITKRGLDPVWDNGRAPRIEG